MNTDNEENPLFVDYSENPVIPDFAITDWDINYLTAIDLAIENAGRMLDMEDAPDGDDEESERLREEIWETRFHCGVCTVREVMEVVWPSIQAYITDLKAAKVAAEFTLETNILMSGLEKNRDKYGYRKYHKHGDDE